MKCPHCDAEIEEGGKFCDLCGKPLEAVVEQPPVASPVGEAPKELVTQPSEPVQPDVAAFPAPAQQTPHPAPHPGRRWAPDAIISHWSILVEGLQASPQAFYQSVQAAIAKRELPDTQMWRVEWPEGGLLSPKRLYLRVRRKDHVFDVCGAPFGNGFFFSWWLGESRHTSIWLLIALSIGLPTLVMILGFAIWSSFSYFFGVTGWLVGLFLYGCLILFGLPFSLLLFAALAPDLVDSLLMQLPWISGVYARYFRPPQYFRIDTASMFRAAVEGAVKEVVDGLTETQGIQRLSAAERKPIFQNFGEW